MAHAIARLLVIAALAAMAGPGQAEPAIDAPPAGLAVDRVVIMMRHGLRPPTKAPPMPNGVAAEAWPTWDVPPGWLTSHGAIAVGQLGRWDGARLRRLGLLPARSCPAAGSVRVIADSDQRTIATAEAWVKAAAPGCAIASDHRPQDEPDPRFSGVESGGGGFDPARADAGVAAAIGPSGPAALDTEYRPLLQRLDAILCGAANAGCGVGGEPTGVVPAEPGKRPKLSGALDRASTAAQILLLEYADGKPPAKIGWGRASVADVTALSAFHALEFRLVARPLAVAAPNLALLTPIIRDGLTGDTRLTLISGHDTQAANLGGLLDVHWHVPGLVADDPSPGGALVIERLSDRKGTHYVRALYRSQTLSQLRSAGPLGADRPYLAVLPIAGCTARNIIGLCTLSDFNKRLGARAGTAP